MQLVTTSRPVRILAATAVFGLALAACTRPDDTGAADDSIPPVASVDTTTTVPATTTTAPATTTTTSTLVPATSAPASSAPAPTTTATTTTAPPSTEPPDEPSDLILTFDSIGPYRFGDRDVDVVPALTEILGAAVSDDLAEYPTADEGSFIDESGDVSFVAPFGRTVCFADSLCAQFGAGAPETLILSGWRLGADGASDLVTEDGVVIGATWADHADVITVDPFNSCFQIAYADAGGIEVVLQSSTEPFAAPDEDGEFVAGDPDPADVTVIELRAGRHPIDVFADC